VPRVSPTPLHHYSSLNHWCKAGWIHAFMLFTANSDPTRNRNRDSPDQAKLFQSSIVKFWCAGGLAPSVFFCCYSPSASRCTMLCAQRCSSTNLVVYKWLFELLLPFYRPKPVILLRPLTSTKDFHPQNYCSLDIFSSFNVT